MEFGPKRKFREIDLFDFTNFFGLYCVYIKPTNFWTTSAHIQSLVVEFQVSLLPLKKSSYISAALLLCKKKKKRIVMLYYIRRTTICTSKSLSSKSMLKFFLWTFFWKKRGPIAKGNEKELFYFFYTEKLEEMVHSVHPWNRIPCM